MWAHEWIVVRHIGSDSLRVCKVVSGYQPKLEPGYNWGGPYDTEAKARAAISSKNSSLRAQLYPQHQNGMKVGS